MTQSLEPANLAKEPYKLTPIQTAWIDFARKFEPYDIFATLTFKESVHPEEATKRYYRFIRKINERLFGRNYRKRGEGVVWICALEWQRRGVLHFHSLIGNGAWRLLLIGVTELWENDKKYKRSRNGENGKAWTEQYNSELGATGYLAKYVSKARQGEIDLFVPHCMKKRLGITPDVNRQFKFLNENNKHNLVVN